LPQVTRDGLSLYYEQEGQGEPPLVLVHGWCCDHTVFESQAEHFRSAHEVISVDLRGCGASDRPEGGYDVPNLADDVAWLCDEVGISRPIVVGHSLGGMIAIELAGRHPGLARAVVAVDPGPIDPLPETTRVWEAFAAQLETAEGETARRAWVEAAFLPTDDEDRRRSLVDLMCAVPLSVAAEGMRGILAWNGTSALEVCRVPTLVVGSRPGGSNDPARLLPLKPDVHFGLTVGAGHFNHLEVPEQVNSMMERFMRVAVGESAE
jgi:pimeloyl-ACP methyl ester carboxylesterase